ncbi:hypothetical protein HELRODRAFT_161050 [Helobdella robusta]|uniref:Uncharacterized protein n=1 Tax=Helobdella robusta TaxID=6412 RepID=T1ER23_HELRO|nr:hypothetical protein HELRODRAFT_161050 [Helobdella robusta]ESO01872.1 hypothetical protein HELRODRAFT_161050 [Helobdella robusta]
MTKRVSFLLFNEVEQTYQICDNVSEKGHPFKADGLVFNSSQKSQPSLERRSILKRSSNVVGNVDQMKFANQTNDNPKNTCHNHSTYTNTFTTKATSNKRRNSFNSSLLRCLQVATKDGNEDSDDGIDEITFPSHQSNNNIVTDCSANTTNNINKTSMHTSTSHNSERVKNIKHNNDDTHEREADQHCAEQSFAIITTNSYSVDHGMDLTSDPTPQQTTSTSIEEPATDLSNYFSDASNASALCSATFPRSNTLKTSSAFDCMSFKKDHCDVNCDPSGCSIDVICTSHELHFKCPCCSAVKTMQPGLNYYYLLKHIFNEDHPHKIMQHLKNCICSSDEVDKQENLKITKRKNSLPRRVAKSLVGRLRCLKQRNDSNVEAPQKQCVL